MSASCMKVFIVLCAALYAAESASWDCPRDFVKISGSCYYFSERPETWHEAQFECRDRNADLAVIRKKWQDKNLRFYLNHSVREPQERWIGGIYNWMAKIWVWGPTGKELRYNGFPKKMDPADNRWKCISMDPHLKHRWSPKSCIERLNYICEIPGRKKAKKRQSPGGPRRRLINRRQSQQQQQERQRQRENEEPVVIASSS